MIISHMNRPNCVNEQQSGGEKMKLRTVSAEAHDNWQINQLTQMDERYTNTMLLPTEQICQACIPNRAVCNRLNANFICHFDKMVRL